MENTIDFSKLKGVLPDSVVRRMLAYGLINNASALNVGSSSLDTSLSSEVYRVQAIPLPKAGQRVIDMIKEVPHAVHDITESLQPGDSYIFALNESLLLPKEVYGFGNPKSTTGRDDIHVRLMADGVSAYDTIPRGYKGGLWLQVKPMSFFCLVKKNVSLSQIRFFTEDTRLRNRQEITSLSKRSGGILFDQDGNLDSESVFADDGSALLSIYTGDDVVGYESIATNEVLDLSAVRSVDHRQFFREITSPPNGKPLYLKKGHFYILSSLEKVRVPEGYACEMRPIDDRLGEVRVHYAGYIDDGWGGDKGATLTLEVRPYEDMYLQVGQPIARIVFEKMARKASLPYTMKSSNYVAQVGPQLAKHFK